MSDTKPLRIEPLYPILSNSCQISFDPQPRTPVYLELFELGQKDPKAALAQLHDTAPELANLKAYLYLRSKNIKAAEATIEETYRLYPKYLPAMVNYADLCLRKRRKKEIPSIFACFDLTQLFPERNLFHFAEFRGFMVTMGWYHLSIGDRAKAELYYILAVKSDPLHPSIAPFERKLFRFRWLRQKFSFFRKTLP